MAININNTNAGTFTIKPPATGGAITLTLPASAGSSGQGLSTDASGNLSFATPSLTGFTTSINSTAPNTPYFTTVIQASGGTANQDIALAQKTANSPLLMIGVPDGSTNGNARGANSVDLTGQYQRSSATNVAAGVGSILIGGNNQTVGSTGYSSVLISSNAASATNTDTFSTQTLLAAYTTTRTTSAFGSTSGLGWITMASIYNSGDGNTYNTQGTHNLITPGDRTGVVSSYAHVMGSTLINATNYGSNQSRRQLLFTRTTNATLTAMTTDNATATTANSITVNNNNTAIVMDIKLLAVQELASGVGDSAAWQINATFTKDTTAASSAINISSNSKTFASAGASTWAATVAANTTLGLPVINITGAGGVTIRWMAYVLTAEVTAYA